jgi:hypothetical protein
MQVTPKKIIFLKIFLFLAAFSKFLLAYLGYHIGFKAIKRNKYVDPESIAS